MTHQSSERKHHHLPKGISWIYVSENISVNVYQIVKYLPKYSHCIFCMTYNYTLYDCDEWGGAESRGNGARPVELMMMSDTCTTHRSRVPRRSSGRIKGGVTTVQDERGPGLDFSLCFVCGSRSSSLTPPASLHSHGSRPRPTRHNDI